MESSESGQTNSCWTYYWYFTSCNHSRSAAWISIFGSLFVGALKAVAPILVLFLVMSAIAKHKSGKKTNIKIYCLFYMQSVLFSRINRCYCQFYFSSYTHHLQQVPKTIAPPSDITEVFQTILFNIVDNPVDALMNANYIGILAWAITAGSCFEKCI